MTKKDDNLIMLPTVDLCFKELMNNPKVRIGFIAALLDIPPEQIKETTLQPTELRREYGEQKLGILDVNVLLQDGTQIDMEMQVAPFRYWDARALFYLCGLFTGQLGKGEPYSKLKRCIHVSILDFIHFPEDAECCHRISLCDKTIGQRYTDLMELRILELKKLPVRTEGEKLLISWMRFFAAKTRKEMRMVAQTDEYIDEAFEELEKLSADKQKWMEYEARQKAIRDYNTQVQSYWEEGQRQLKLELIRKKLARGKSLEQIAEDLETDVESVRTLAEEISGGTPSV